MLAAMPSTVFTEWRAFYAMEAPIDQSTDESG